MTGPTISNLTFKKQVQNLHPAQPVNGSAMSAGRPFPGALKLTVCGLFCRRPAKKSRLTDMHKRTRLAWATRYRRYTQKQWANFIFSDESSFPIEKCDKRKRVYRRVNERFADGCIQSVDDKRSVMVWGAISIRGKSNLIIAQGNIDANAYQNNILTPGLLPFLNAVPNPGQWKSSSLGRPLTQQARPTSLSMQKTCKSWVLGRLNHQIQIRSNMFGQ